MEPYGHSEDEQVVGQNFDSITQTYIAPTEGAVFATGDNTAGAWFNSGKDAPTPLTTGECVNAVHKMEEN